MTGSGPCGGREGELIYVHYPVGLQRACITMVLHDSGHDDPESTGSHRGSRSSDAEVPPRSVRDFQFVAVLQADAAAVSRARRLLQRLLCTSGLSGIAEDVALGAGELMANAVTHACQGASSGFTVRATCQRGRVRLEVQDPSADRPCVRPLTDGDEGGRRLFLVQALSHRWEVEDGPSVGKTVWMELDGVAGAVTS